MNKEEFIKKSIEDLKEMVNKSRDLREEEFYQLIGIHNIQAIATVLGYIEELEKELKDYRKLTDKYEEEHRTVFKEWCNSLSNSIPKQKVRDKIKLFELEIETLKTLYPKTYTRDDDYKLYVYKIDVLKELLGEGD